MTRYHSTRALCNTKNASKQEKFYVARALSRTAHHQIHPGHKRMVYSHKHTLAQELVFSGQSVRVEVELLSHITTWLLIRPKFPNKFPFLLAITNAC